MRTREMPAAKCFYFGCLKSDGHFLYAPDGRTFWNDLLDHVGEVHIDGTLAPRKVRIGSKLYYSLEHSSQPVWQAMGESREDRDRLSHDSSECPQGQYLLHVLANGFTAIQWWDRCQGDRRGASNSTILLSGVHTAKEMLAAGKEHFPEVFERLEKAGVKLINVTPRGTQPHTCVEGDNSAPDHCPACEVIAAFDPV